MHAACMRMHRERMRDSTPVHTVLCNALSEGKVAAKIKQRWRAVRNMESALDGHHGVAAAPAASAGDDSQQAHVHGVRHQ